MTTRTRLKTAMGKLAKTLLEKLIEGRIEARDGMHVDAKIWQTAHNYHRYQQQAHALFGHGTGIVAGLEILADEDPRSRMVWIQPGIAVSPTGQTIVLEEKTSYTIKADQKDLVYLFLIGKEGEPNKDYIAQDGSAFKSTLGLDKADVENGVELARFRLKDSGVEIRDAKNPDQPDYSEIDLRFRQIVGAISRETVSIAIKYIGQTTDASLPPYRDKIGQLTRALNHISNHRICIDEIYSLTSLSPYTLLYLIEQGDKVKLDQNELDALKTHLQKGGTLFVESYQPMTNKRSAFADIFEKIEVSIQEISTRHPLLIEPFFFSRPPAGDAQGGVFVDEGVIFSTCDYGRLWQREMSRNGGVLSRETLRAALEWGANIVTYAAHRQSNYKRQ